MIWISLISLAFLLLIAISDIKTRQIPIIYLVGETIVSSCLGYNLIGMLILKCTVTNLVIITFQTLILWRWVKIKESKSNSSLWSKFGKGDVFMLFISAISLSALNYLFFIVVVSLTSIIIWGGLSKMRKINDQTIPFAGFLASGMVILRIFQIAEIGSNYYSDNFIFNLINGIY